MVDLNNTYHVMVDLETLGLDDKAIVLSIATGFFNPKWEEIKMISSNLETEPQREVGRTTDNTTLKWWETQSDQAKNALLVNIEHPQSAITEHGKAIQAFQESMKDFRVLFWGNSPNFDLNKLESLAFDFRYWLNFPDYHRRCFKTVRDVMCSYYNAEYDESATTHIATDDVRQQAAFMRKIIREFNL
jgi:hypothetical protein